MKKKSLLVIIILSLCIISSFMFTGCKDDTVAATTEMKTEAEPEHYIYVSMMWSHPVWQQAKYGGQKAEEFWNKNGANMKVDFVGPQGDDIDGMYAALEASVAKNPTGIIYLDWGAGEGPLLTKYAEGGGMISSWVGVGENGKWPVDHVGGIDNEYFGEDLAKWAIEERGESFTVGIMTITDNPQHILRVKGIRNILDKYPGIKIIEPYMEETNTPEGAAANASAFISANPDVEVLLGTGAQCGGAMGRATKEGGFPAGEKLIIGSDQDPDLIQLMKEDYVLGSLGYSFSVDIFSSITWMHLAHLGAVNYTKEDKKYDIWPAPWRSITPSVRFTKANADLMGDMPVPK